MRRGPPHALAFISPICDWFSEAVGPRYCEILRLQFGWRCGFFLSLVGACWLQFSLGAIPTPDGQIRFPRNFPVGTEENMAVQAPGSTLLWNALNNEPVT